MYTEKCTYGCDNEAKFTLKNGKFCCSKSQNSCPSNKKKNADALRQCYADGIKFKVFSDEDRQKSILSSLTRGARVALTKNSTYSNGAVVNLLFKLSYKENKCECCGISEWNGKSITMELHHVNGLSSDNRIENLQFLCPNCHSQTENFRGKNINSGDIKVTDEELIESIKNSPNIRKALINVGMAGKGLNYQRMYKLIQEHNLKFNIDKT